MWRHTRRGDKYVTVIIDLTPVREGTGPARLLDMVEGRSKQAFKTWLAERPEPWRDAIDVVAMDGFTGFKTATAEEMPDAVAVMDPFHVVRLAGDALDKCRRRVQLAIHGHRGHKDDPLYSARRTLHTGAGLLTDRQKDRLAVLFANEAHVEVEATWGIYQRMVAAYREPDRTKGRELMVKLIEPDNHGGFEHHLHSAGFAAKVGRDRGVRIVHVEERRPAERADLGPGDLMVTAAGEPVSTRRPRRVGCSVRLWTFRCPSRRYATRHGRRHRTAGRTA